MHSFRIVKKKNRRAGVVLLLSTKVTILLLMSLLVALLRNNGSSSCRLRLMVTDAFPTATRSSSTTIRPRFINVVGSSSSIFPIHQRQDFTAVSRESSPPGTTSPFCTRMHLFPSSQISVSSLSSSSCYSTRLFSSTSSSTSQNLQGHSTISILLDGLNENQIDAVTKPTYSITRVLAGPGSGKTRVLTSRVAYLLEEDRQGRVLAVTFTRKAAGEMQARVENLLRQQQQLLGQNNKKKNEQSPMNDLSQNQGTASSIEEEIAQETVTSNDDSADSLPQGLERVTLGTFHSVCAKILRYNGNLLPQLPSVVDDWSRRRSSQQDDAIRTTLNLDGNFVIVDQSDQLRIVKECMDELGIDPKKLPPNVKPLTILNSVGQIKENLSQGLDPLFQSNNNGSTGKGGSGKKPPSPSLKVANQIYYLYREKLFVTNAVDFNDLIYMTRELLMHHKHIQQRLHRRWSHVLVDEFQDTSKSQLELVQLLTSQSLFVVGDADQSIYSWRGAHVGSMDDFKPIFQEIGYEVDTVYLKENYRSTSNIVRAAEKVISSQSSSFSNNPNDNDRRSMKPKRGSGPSPRVVACFDERAEANFVVDSILDMIDSRTLDSDNTVAIIYRTNAQSRHLEEACVQKKLPYVIRGGAGGFYKRQEVKDCLCFLKWLYNGNDVGAMLRAIKTPARGIGQKALEEFQDYCDEVNAYHQEQYPGLKPFSPLDVLISMTENEESTSRSAAPLLREGAPTPDIFISKRALNNFKPFSRQMRDLREKAHHAPLDILLFHIIEEFDLVSHFDAISKSKSEFEERRANVQELRKATKRYSKDNVMALQIMKENGSRVSKEEEGEEGTVFLENETPLGNFLDDVALVTDLAGELTDENKRLVANLMTIHASKGTEFDAVFVVGNEEGTLPSGLAIQEGENSVELEEEKRLCYVAMTRAKTQLCMTWRKEVTNYASWSDSGSRTSQKDRSRFLDALVSKKSKTNNNGSTIPKRRDVNNGTGRSNAQPRRNYSTGMTTANETRRCPPVGNVARQISRSSARSNDSSDFQLASPRRNNNGAYHEVESSHSKGRDSPRQERNRGTQDRSRGKLHNHVVPHDVDRKVVLKKKKKKKKSLTSSPELATNLSRGVTTKRSSPPQNYRSPSTPPEERRQPQRSFRSSPLSSRAEPETASITPNTQPAASRRAASRGSSSASSSQSAGFDSTWIFPIGSDVTHKSFGKGKVLPPPSSGPDKEMMVRVEFQNGKTMEFHAGENSITPL